MQMLSTKSYSGVTDLPDRARRDRRAFKYLGYIEVDQICRKPVSAADGRVELTAIDVKMKNIVCVFHGVRVPPLSVWPSIIKEGAYTLTNEVYIGGLKDGKANSLSIQAEVFVPVYPQEGTGATKETKLCDNSELSSISHPSGLRPFSKMLRDSGWLSRSLEALRVIISRCNGMDSGGERKEEQGIALRSAEMFTSPTSPVAEGRITSLASTPPDLIGIFLGAGSCLPQVFPFL